ncbi:hydrolase [Steroidobacter agaridevorans]|uniref:Hydrolase n=1 Tax=Steroidobacter agaridevorans TaxID=2695856 RepID=A0A829YR35_9GAMM|nr:alpha/beta hydrolase [Steroidobacter agaridevorans]GFE84916.1 hydrolase [Steroidobacter agaridevorans]
MSIGTCKTRHRTVSVNGLELFIREAGEPDRPAVLLLHGAPSSSHTFRNLLPLLADTAYLVAPDMPGFGFSEAPPQQRYEYSFENIASTIEALTDVLGLKRMFLYVHDYGAPVAYQLALRRPGRVLGLIVQNGSAHDEGMVGIWDDAKAFWADPSPENRAKLPDWLNFEGARAVYLDGVPQRLKPLFPPECWHLDWERMSRPGNVEIQFKLFEDYKNYVARFPDISRYHREHQPPCLIIWGRHDVYYALEEIIAYARELDRLEMHVLDGAHFLLETHCRECADAIRGFIASAAR